MNLNSIFANKFVKKLLNFLQFMACWALLANALIFFNPTPHYNPSQTPYFQACVIKDDKPLVINIQDKTPTQPFCQQQYVHRPDDNNIYFHQLEKINEEWQLTTYSDSISDPWVYRYRIENNQLVPLWYTYGGMMVSLSFWLSALLILAIAQAILKRIIRYKNKKTS